MRDLEQTVYGDILFFVNFCMDLQCLYLTARLLHRPFRLWRGMVASALGALYACVALFLPLSGALAFCLDLGVCLLMCILTFWSAAGGRMVLIPFAVYFGVSMAVGGVMSGMATLLSRVDVIPMQGQELSSVSFFLLAALGGGATFLWGRLCQRRAKGRYADLTLTLGETTLTVRCMVDTANLLRDPVGGRPVVLLDHPSAARLLPPALMKVAETADHRDAVALPTDLAKRLRWIPAVGATGQRMLLAFAPDRALLDAGRGAVEVALLIAPASLAVRGTDCDGLLPAELIAE